MDWCGATYLIPMAMSSSFVAAFRDQGSFRVGWWLAPIEPSDLTFKTGSGPTSSNRSISARSTESVAITSATLAPTPPSMVGGISGACGPDGYAPAGPA
jgi:hypothetical protein